MLIVSYPFDVGIDASQVLQARFAHVAHRLKLAIRQRFEVAYEIRAPVPAPDNTYCNCFFHNHHVLPAGGIYIMIVTARLIASAGASVATVQRTSSRHRVDFSVLPEKTRAITSRWSSLRRQNRRQLFSLLCL